ncbi:MAG TPA: FAD-dependent oxidoreductase [Solirubrobacterales bacterium]|nr:FAD-dependent oxidoreductase [Solirubrobacterales bacterium]
MSADREQVPRVLIAGGGIAGLEALLALHDLGGDRLELTLVAPEPDFTYKPLTVEEPFSMQPAEHHELAPIAAELGAGFVQSAVTAVDPEAHQLVLSGDQVIGYDVAVLCVGARNVPAFSRAITFRASGESLELERILGQDPAPERIAFVVPPSNTWPLPIYELALMTQRRARELGLRELEFLIVTPEEAPLLVFGTVPSAAVSEVLRARGIEVRCGAHVREEEDGGLSLHPGGEQLEASHVIALPKLEGPAIPGVPADEGGFIPIDEHARVKGAGDLYAAGDGTNFPVKQGGLGTQQADAAAEHISARFGAELEPRPFEPVLRGMLIVGGESLSMEHSLRGGAGEGDTSSDYLWWPPHKVSGRYLAAWLAGETVHTQPRPPARPLEVEVALPHEWHREPMALDPLAPPPD